MRTHMLATALLVAALPGCESVPKTPTNLKYVTVDQVKAEPTSYDSKEVGIKGFMMADVMGSVSLYATSEDAIYDKMYDAIDILTKDKNLREEIKYKTPTCVIAIGKFRTFKSGEFNFDMPSKTGVMDLSGVTKC